MNKIIFRFFSLLSFCSVLLAACDFPSTKPDPCVLPQVQQEVGKVHAFTRAFDDITTVAANTPRNQLGESIVKLQAIRRDAEDLEVPLCLTALKVYQLGHMNEMIDMLLVFMSGTDITAINQKLAQAQFQRQKYNEEYSRLLNVTLPPIQTSTPLPTMLPPVSASTPEAIGDRCSPENLPVEVEKVHQIMRSFDDWSNIAINIPKAGLSEIIANLQSIRRQAQDYQVPDCLVTLKQLELDHMETVINTLLTFLSGSDSVAVSQGIAQARAQHDQYNAEYSRLLGITVVPAGTPAPAALQQVTNSVSAPINIRRYPVENAEVVGQLDGQQSADAVGKSLDGGWILIYIPGTFGYTGWVSAEVVDIPDLSTLPAMTPIP